MGQNIYWSNTDVIQVTLVTASVILVFVARVLQYNFLSSHVFSLKSEGEAILYLYDGEGASIIFPPKSPKSLFCFTNMT